MVPHSQPLHILIVNDSELSIMIIWHYCVVRVILSTFDIYGAQLPNRTTQMVDLKDFCDTPIQKGGLQWLVYGYHRRIMAAKAMDFE